MIAAMMKGTPPTTLSVMNVVVAERLNMIVRPKLSGRLLSRPFWATSQ